MWESSTLYICVVCALHKDARVRESVGNWNTAVFQLWSLWSIYPEGMPFAYMQRYLYWLAVALILNKHETDPMSNINLNFEKI